MSARQYTRRGILTAVAGLAATGTVGAAAVDPARRKPVLDAMSRTNDRVQATLFDPDRLAPTYPAGRITRPFPYNGFYPQAYAPALDPATWRLTIAGRVARPAKLSLGNLRTMPQQAEITRLICIEGWSAVGRWSGVPLAELLARQGADLGARFVRFGCADGYHTSIDMASALHSQTIIALDFLDRPLPRPFGAPARLRLPVKLGFKNAKFITEITVTDVFPGGYWEDQGYNWFAGL